MIRWLGVILVLSGSWGLGWYYSSRLKRQEKILLLGQQYMRMLRGIISFGAEPLPEALKEMADRSQPPWQEFFRRMAAQLVNREGGFGNVWQQTAGKCLGAYLTAEDLDSFIRTGQNLGYLDKEMQLAYLDMLLKEWEESYDMMHRQSPEKCRLYTACGILGGLFLVVFLI